MLTPIDIQNKDFEVKFRGYDSDDVDNFMDMLATDYEKLYKENIELKDKMNVLNDALERYKSMEGTLQNSIILAQSAGEDIRRNANTQAENIISEANMKAKDIIKEANEEITQLRNDLTALKLEVSSYKARMQATCASLNSMLEKME